MHASSLISFILFLSLIHHQLNGTAIGILSQHWKADSELIREMILERMNRLYVKSYAPRNDEELLTPEERKRMSVVC